MATFSGTRYWETSKIPLNPWHLLMTGYILIMRYLKIITLLLILVPGTVFADQTNPALNELFRALQVTTSTKARDIENKIWSLWVVHDNNPDATGMMRLGMQMMQANELAEADRIFSRLIDKEPDFAEAWNKRATVRYIMGDHDASKADIVEVLKREPRHFGALSGLAMIHMQNGNLKGALSTYEAALQVNPFMLNAQQMIDALKLKLQGQAL
jgi:Tfp pilus assembly protein PilF